jgi:hypothetical protein
MRIGGKPGNRRDGLNESFIPLPAGGESLFRIIL